MGLIGVERGSKSRPVNELGMVDVVVSFSKGGGHRHPSLVFSINKVTQAKAFGKSKRINPKIDEKEIDNPTKIYFVIDEKIGYKISETNAASSRSYLTPTLFTEEYIKNPESWCGDYDLKFDAVNYHVWYIDLNEKISY